MPQFNQSSLKRVAASIGVLGVLGGAVRATRLYSHSSAKVQTFAQTEKPNDAVVLRWIPRPGETRMYHFERGLKMSFAGADTFHLDYGGTLTIGLRPDAGDRILQFGLIWDTEYLKNLEPGSRSAFTDPRSAPIFVQVSPDGKIQNLRALSTDVRDPVRSEKVRVMKDVVAQYFFMENRDEHGSYVAKVQNDSAKNLWKKTKISYSSDQGIEILTSQHELAASDQGSILSISGEDALKIRGFESDATYKFEARESQTRAPASIGSGLGPTEEVVLQGRSPADRSWDGDTGEGWKNAVHALPQTPAADRWGLFRRLLKLASEGRISSLELEQEARQFLAQGNADGYKWMVGVLATAGSPEDQQSLVRIYQDLSPGSNERQLVLTAMTTTEAPLTDASRAFLSGISSGSSDPGEGWGATFALGADASKAGATTTEVGDVESTLEAKLANARTDADRLLAIDAVGNTGDPKLLPALESYLQSDSSSVRAKAVFALRKMPPAQTAPFFQQALQDPSAQVRFSAQQAEAEAQQNNGG